MEYTYISIFFSLIIIILDFALKTKLILDKRFYAFWVFMFLMILIINGYLTARPIVIYDNNFNLNFRFLTIPIEDFLFGFSLITLNIIIWEIITKKLIKK